MATLFRLRHRVGLGVLFCALGTMHFLETYLAAILYLQFPFGIAISPGSTILFTGKLVMLLLIYVREDAATVRQPIYGLLLGNFLVVALVMLMRMHDVSPVVPGGMPDFSFMDQMGWLMIWGTILLFIDSILIILLYEQSGPWLGRRTTLRIWLAAAAVLTFDHLCFFLVLHLFLDAPGSVLLGGWLAKMAAAVCYAVLAGIYLRRFDVAATGRSAPRARLGDIFDMLTYRQRYEDLLEASGRDTLTGLLNRGRFDAEAARLVAEAVARGTPLSLLVIDVDHFKSVNDRYGHASGDRILRQVADCLARGQRGTDLLFRYGGEEFVMVCPGLPAAYALKLAERVRRQVEVMPINELGENVTVSIGVSSCPEDGQDPATLFACADARLYSAKYAGRNRVWGGEYVSWLARDRRTPAAGDPQYGSPT